jgi:hypothetical protein
MTPLVLWLSMMVLVISSVNGRIRKDDNPTGRDIQIVNDSDVKVDIFWINPQTKELVKSLDAGLLKGTDSMVNSYIGHEFEAQEVPRKSTGTCRAENNECMKGHFVVTSNEDQRFTIEKDLSVTYEDARSRAMEKAKKVSEECPMPQTSSGDGLPDLEEWATCLQQRINDTLHGSKEEIEFQADVRKNMGQRLVNFACSDEEFPQSKSTYNQTLNLGLGPQRNPKMKYLFQSETNKVILLENFVARSQCKWLKESAERGGKNRLEWSAIGDVAIRTVVERIYKALDQTLEYSVPKEFLDEQRISSGEHPLFELHSIDSAANGGTDVDTNRFLAENHAGHPLMATLILFCDVPEKGAAIHFPKSGTHVKPEVGHALLISYLDHNTGETGDDAFTSEFVECPVVEGKRTTLKYHIPLPRD